MVMMMMVMIVIMVMVMTMIMMVKVMIVIILRIHVHGIWDPCYVKKNVIIDNSTLDTVLAKIPLICRS